MDTSRKSLAYYRGVKLALAASDYDALPNYGPSFGALGAAGGTALGTLLGAHAGELFAKQTPKHLFNIPLPGTQRVENEHGRLAGSILGGLAGGALGFYGGHGAGDALAKAQAAKAREQELQKLLRLQTMPRQAY
jgi:hypothetical protein